MELTNVLFVCLGNICRSPTAHGVFRDLVEKENLSASIRVDSAGTSGWHIGEPPDRRATAAAAKRGYQLSDLRGRQCSPSDFLEFDYILAMDEDNLAALESLRPASFEGVLSLFLDFSAQSQLREVPDPYYGGVRGFEDVLDLVEDACQGLLTHIKQQRP